MRNEKLQKLTLCGIYLTITEAGLILASFIPGFEMTVLAITSAVGAFVIIEAGVKYGIGFYAAALLLGLILVPNKLGLIPYGLFFGLYPVVKYFAEKNPKTGIQVTIKLCYFIGVTLAAYYLLFDIFFGNLRLPEWLPTVLVIPAAIGIMLLLDWILTALINFYFRQIRPKFRR